MRLRVLGGCFAAFLVSSCSETGPAAPAGASLEIVSGDGQSGEVGQVLPEPLVVLVRDSTGEPLPGVGIRWALELGAGTVEADGETGTDGTASAVWTLGVTSGPKLVAAQIAGGGATVTFAATALAGPAVRMLRSGGDGQSAFAGTTLALPLEVAVVDRYGNGVPDVAVSWTAPEGASVDPALSSSDAIGRATTFFTLGPAPGPQSVVAVADVPSGSPVTFSATALAPVALVSAVPIPANYGVHDEFVRDGLAFVSAWNTGLMIFDVGNGVAGGSPSNPVLVSSIVTAASGVPGGAQVHNAWWFWNAFTGERRYVFVGQEGGGSLGTSSSGDIHVVDVFNLTQPVEVASYRMSGAGTHNFWVDEAAQVLYAAYYNGGVVALDVSGTLSGDLANREIARVQPGGAGNTYVWGVQLHRGSLYAIDMLSGLWQLRLTGSTLGVQGGGSNVPERYSSDLWAYADYVYTGTWGFRSAAGNAIKVWRLDGSGAPALTDSVIVPGIGTVSDLEVSADGRLLVISAEGGTNPGLHFYALANPSRPTLLGLYRVPNGVHTMTIAEIGGRRYVFAAQDPPNPALLILDATGTGP